MPESNPQSHLGSGWSFPINDMVLSYFARTIQAEEKCELMTYSDLDPNQAKVLQITVFFSFSVLVFYHLMECALIYTQDPTETLSRIFF